MLHSSQSQSDGPPVLFLHAAGYDSRMWGEVVDLLPDFRSILLDLPGHGQSGSIEMKSFADAADDVAITVKALGYRKIHIAGVSMGSYVGFQLMLRHPELVTNAILSGFQYRPIQIPKSAKAMMHAFSWFTRLRIVRERMARSMGIQDMSLISAPDGSANCSAETTRHVGNLALQFDVEADLSKAIARTLVLAGSKEHTAIKSCLPGFQENLPNGTAGIVPGLGHGWIANAPELFAETIRAWIEDSALPDRLELIAPR
ncbi:MAG: alpha/beta hydrolase [Roseibium sp.]